MTQPGSGPGVVGGKIAGVVTMLCAFAAAYVYWWVAIYEGASLASTGMGVADLYIAHYPMTELAFGRLSQGEIPLWNPYQICGTPLLAVPYVGTFYPLNAVYLFWDMATATEVSFVLHMGIGLASTWFLARRIGMSALASLVAAVTFTWSGYAVSQFNQPSLHAAMNLMPLVLLQIERVMAGAAWAGVLLSLAIGGFLLDGAAEMLMHTLYFGAAYTLARLSGLAWGGQWKVGVRRAALVLACVLGGATIAAVQLLPTLELSRLGVRSLGTMSLLQTLAVGFLPRRDFLEYGLMAKDLVNVGCLPLLLFPLALRGSSRILAGAFVLVAVASSELANGGLVHRVYFESFLGGMFRRPIKFFDIYSLAQALLAGGAITYLTSLAREDQSRIVRDLAWFASLVIAAIAAVWLHSLGREATFPLIVLVCVALFPIFPSGLRKVVVLFVAGLQVTSLFLSMPEMHLRPIHRTEKIFESPRVYAQLHKSDGRSYLSPRMTFHPGLTAKSAMRQRLLSAVDYEPLVGARAAEYFQAASGQRRRPGRPFDGPYRLGQQSSYRLLDHAGVQTYLVTNREEAAVMMSARNGRGRGFRKIAVVRHFSIFGRADELVRPRVSVVHRARALPSPESVLEVLKSPQGKADSEVLLEREQSPTLVGAASDDAVGEAKIIAESPEEVTVAVSSSAPGYLVLLDQYYPGWVARLDGREVPIYRANYLFRAVSIESGESTVVFSYEPAAFRAGSVISLLGFGIVLMLGLLRNTGRLANLSKD